MGRPGDVEGCDPALTALFTPEHPRLGRYEVCTTSVSIDQVVSGGTAEAVPYRYGTVEALEPLEAFGSAGPYDRFAISRLYGGRRVQVAHGWRAAVNQFESVTLISPHPDASLTRLVSGTMVIRWTCRMQNAECH